MEDELIVVLLGLLLVIVAILALKVFVVLALLVTLLWLGWRLLRRAILTLACWIGEGRQALCVCWNELWDPLEKARRQAMKEIEQAAQYYVEVQRRAAERIDLGED